MDEEIIQSASRGDTEAFRQLVETYSDLAWRTARILLPTPFNAEDAVQEAWIDVWKGLARFQSHRPFRPWLLKIVANRCRKIMRDAAPATLSLYAERIAHPLLDDATPDQLQQSEMSIDIKQAFAGLSVEQRTIVELRFYADLDLQDIADVLGVPLGTVKSRLHRSLQSMREQLQAQPPSPSMGEKDA